MRLISAGEDAGASGAKGASWNEVIAVLQASEKAPEDPRQDASAAIALYTRASTAEKDPGAPPWKITGSRIARDHSPKKRSRRLSLLLTALASRAHMPRPWVAMTMMLSRGWMIRSWT